MQPGDNLIDPAGSNHGVLSHRAGKHLQNLVEAGRTSFDEADEQTDVSEDRMRPRKRLGRGRYGSLGGRDESLSAPSVEQALLQFTGLVAIIGDTALVRLTPAMGFATTKRTPQITSTGIARVGEKKDPAVPTASQALAQPWENAQDRSQRHTIGHDHVGHRALPIPLGVEAKMSRDLGGKKPRLWLWIPTLLNHPLRYRNGLWLSRWRKGNFLQPLRPGIGNLTGPPPPEPNHRPVLVDPFP